MASRFINIINVPSDLGSVYAGKSRAPAAFNSAGLHEKLETAEFQVSQSNALLKGSGVWSSTTREPNGARNEANVVNACQRVYETVAGALSTDKEGFGAPPFQLILAGECLFCPPIMSAYWRYFNGSGRSIGIIYVDADCDLYTPTEPNSSGNIAGMTLTHLTLREGALESMKGFSRPDGSGVVDSSNIVLFGLNIESPANKRPHLGYLFDNNFKVVTSQAIEEAPLARAQEALKWISDRVDFIIVHLDVDVIDPGEFPLGNVPSYTGLSFEGALSAVKTFLGSEKVVALSIAEVNPDHDPGLKMTTRLVEEVIEGLKARM